jgi:F-type H+-transporting ATPase subunit gamma
MANLRDIRRRIKSVKNTRQITRAMQLVSSSKMKRAQDAAVAGRPYALLLADLLDTVGEKLDLSGATISHPFFEKREIKTRGILILSTDKGLCGALNSNLFRKIAEEVKGATKFITVGRKATQFVSRSGRGLVADFSISDKAAFSELRPMLKLLIDAYKNGEVDTIEIAYPSFVNVSCRSLSFSLSCQSLICVKFWSSSKSASLISLRLKRAAIPAKWFSNHLRKLFLMHCLNFT